MKPLFLTIDDAPSPRFGDKLGWLRREKVMALFFVWGERIAGNEDLLIQALQAGYRLGNHSWSHPYFSQLSFEEGCGEIERCEHALEALYAAAGQLWAPRYFRFPYFDRGGDPERVAAYQAYLAGRGYTAFRPQPGGPIDMACDFDQAEYWLGNPQAPEGLDRADTILARIGEGRPGPGDIVLIHDHDYSHELFFECVRRYQASAYGFEG
jgi:peptidoglycan/xylan/chitin deacetylase (PgdA/CDA1 family)